VTVAQGPIVQIARADDARLVPYRHLNDPAVSRRLAEVGAYFVVEGRVAVGRLLRSDYPVHSLLVDDHQLELAASLVEGVRALGAPVLVAPRHVVAETVGFDLHRGVVALAHRLPPMDVDAVVQRTVLAEGHASPMLAVLEGLNDHENIGALFRNAGAFGVGGVLLSPTCADPLYRRSVRVSSGQVMRVPFARVATWPDVLGEVRAAGVLIAALVPRPETGSDASRSVGVAELVRRLSNHPQPVALLLGAEGPGLSAPAIDAADVAVSIPMAAEVDSLNVATAAAIVFHRIAES
jgi:tRNA G18 (ribose-2'-O)-methylase SpoU